MPSCIAEFAYGAAPAARSASVAGLSATGITTAAIVINQVMQGVAGGPSPSTTAFHAAVAIGGLAAAASSSLFSKAMIQVDRAIGQPVQILMPARKLGRVFAFAATAAIGLSTAYEMHDTFCKHTAAKASTMGPASK